MGGVDPFAPQAGRVPPSDLDAEAAVLSACVLDPNCVDDVREILVPSDMYADANRRILDAIYSLQDAKKEVDIVAVAGVLRDNKRLDQVGGTPYLAQLADATPAVAHVVEHAMRVKDKAKIRVMIAACQKFAAEGYGDVGPTADWLEEVEKTITAAANDRRDQEKTAVMYGEGARQAYKTIAESARTGATMVGFPTGFDELDNHVGGLAGGDFWIVGGYPGIGKTSWVKQAAESVALHTTRDGDRVGVAFFSLEMKTRQLMMRSMARRSEIPFANVRIGRMQPKQWNVLVNNCQDEAPKVAMVLDEGRDLTPHRMRRKLRQHLVSMRQQFGNRLKLGAVVVDYIQLMTPNRASKNRAEELGAISKELKSLAGEFDCAVIALSALNRPEQKARPKAPGMSALRESGALEFDADVILMIHRDDPFKDKAEAHDNIAELVVVKGRNSGPSRHEVKFDGRFTAFYPLSHMLYSEVEARPEWWDPQ